MSIAVFFHAAELFVVLSRDQTDAADGLVEFAKCPLLVSCGVQLVDLGEEVFVLIEIFVGLQTFITTKQPVVRLDGHAGVRYGLP